MTAGARPGRSVGSVAHEPPGWASAVARMGAAAAVVIAAVVLLGWAIDAHVLRAFSTGAVAMKTNAAVGVVMAGVAVLVKVGDPPRRRRLAGDGLGLACAVLGLVTLAECVTGWQPGIDELLISEPPTAVRTSSPNRMAASAALCLVLLGAAVVLLSRGRRATVVAQCLAGVVGVLGVLALVGYGFGSSLLYQWRRSTAAKMPAGIAFRRCWPRSCWLVRWTCGAWKPSSPPTTLCHYGCCPGWERRRCTHPAGTCDVAVDITARTK